MSDSALVNRFIARTGSEGTESDEGACDNLGCFGWLRGIRDRAVMLELRKATGNILAIGYAWIDRIALDPSDGITIHAAGQRIILRGKNLNGPSNVNARLFDGLTRHRVPWIQELSQADAITAATDSCIVESIEW